MSEGNFDQAIANEPFVWWQDVPFIEGLTVNPLTVFNCHLDFYPPKPSSGEWRTELIDALRMWAAERIKVGERQIYKRLPDDC